MSEETTSQATENTNDAATGNQTTQPTLTQTAQPTADAPKAGETQTATTLAAGAEGEGGTAAPAGTETKDAPKEGEEKPAEGAPEKYEPFKAPEGVTIDPAVEAKFGEVAKELNLPQDKAQAVIDKLAPEIATRQMAQIQAISQDWAERSMKDPELIQEAANKFPNVARTRDAFAKNADGTFDKDIAEFMNSPAGNHPGVLKLLARVGKAFGEGGFPTGKPSPKRITADDVYS